jgi:hypothetical protein
LHRWHWGKLIHLRLGIAHKLRRQVVTPTPIAGHLLVHLGLDWRLLGDTQPLKGRGAVV